MLMTAPNPSLATPDFAALRRTMVDCQIRTFDVTDQALLARFLEIPREIFLPPELAAVAYSDVAQKIKICAPDETRRTLLPPLILARLIQAAEVVATDKILDIAPGSGYSTAIFSALGAKVVALESDPALAEMIAANLAKIALPPARAITGSLAAGAPADAPFDLIFVNGAVESGLEPLFAQLKDGGRLIAIKTQSVEQASVPASHAIRFEKVNGIIGSRYLFDARAPVLTEFRRGLQFVF
ncbi:MAG: protein-L-isoaspartate O-methyltransferase family protein [Beijerinckiaceae bacterium]